MYGEPVIGLLFLLLEGTASSLGACRRQPALGVCLGGSPAARA